jgi:hypothetical protein
MSVKNNMPATLHWCTYYNDFELNQLVDFQVFDGRSVAITATKYYDIKSDGYEDKKA